MTVAERYFVPVSATGASISGVIPLEGKSNISGFEYREQDGYVVVPGVPVFDEHKDPSRRPPFDDVTGKTFQDIFDATKDAEGKGSYAALIVGHTTGVGDDQARPVEGFARNFRMRGKEPERVIVADLWFKRDFFESSVRQNLFPRRSPEISTLDMRIDPIALLGATSPARALPDMIFHRGGDREVYMTDRPEPATFRRYSQMPEDIADQVKKINERIDGFEKGMERLNESVARLAKAHNAKDDDPDEKDKESVDSDEKEKESKGGDKAVFSDPAVRERFSQLQAELKQRDDRIAALTAGLDQLESRRVAAEVDARIEQYKRQGVMFGTDEEEAETRKDLIGMRDQESRDRFYKIIESRFSRAPVGASIDRRGLDASPPADDAEVSYADMTMARAERYAKDNKCSLEDAVKRLAAI